MANQSSLYGPAAEFYEALYRRHFEHHDELRAETGFLAYLFEGHSEKTGKPVERVLDVGCGAGTHSFPLVKKGFCVTGLDLSSRLIQMARRRKPQLPQRLRKNIHFSKGDMRAFSFARKFDAVFCFYNAFLHNWSDAMAVKALSRFRDAVAPGGLVAIGMTFQMPEMKKGGYPFFYTNTARLGKKMAIEISDEKVDFKRRIRFEHHDFYISQDGGETWKKECSDVKLMLFEPDHFKKLVLKSGLGFKGYLDLHTGRPAGKKTEEFVAVCTRK